MSSIKIPFDEFEISRGTEENLEEILELQEETLAGLDNPVLLRRNTEEMILSCLREPNYTIIVRYKGELAAIAVLFVPDDEENLAKYLSDVEYEEGTDVNYKLCIVKDKFRGNSLQYETGMLLLEEAKNRGYKIACSTVSPYNEHSRANIVKMGFAYNRTLSKYGFDRHLFYKFL